MKPRYADLEGAAFSSQFRSPEERKQIPEKGRNRRRRHSGRKKLLLKVTLKKKKKKKKKKNYKVRLSSIYKYGVFKDRSKTRRLAACTQAVVILTGTSYIAIELNVLHLKSFEIQSNRYMCAQAILPLIAFLEIDIQLITHLRERSQGLYISL